MQAERIVCLANSSMGRRYRCVAGKKLEGDIPSGWIRLVGGDGEGQEGIPVRLVRYVKLLDIIEVSLLEPLPRGHQQENWLLDVDPTALGRVEREPWRDPYQLVDSVEPLWINVTCSNEGKNDGVPYPQIGGIQSSLRFIQVDELMLRAFGNTVRGQFQYGGVEYSLRVTDPDYETPSSEGFEKSDKIHKCFLTVSLAGEYVGREPAYYKLIAAIIPCDEASTA